LAIPTDLSSIVLVIGGFGTAAFGLVDATKILPKGGVSNVGFSGIKTAVGIFLPSQSGQPNNDPLHVLHGNWINGRSLVDQKAIAKSLVKLQLSANTAKDFATATGIDANSLVSATSSIAVGAALNPSETNALGRFDLTLTSILDGAYQHADQRYRNAAKVLAMIFAVVLAVLAAWSVSDSAAAFFHSSDLFKAVLCGLLATPIAPFSKDLASALQAGVKVAQAVKT